MLLIAGLTFTAMLIAVAGMAIGAMVTGQRLKGSCGGEGGADCICDREGRPRECERPNPTGEAPLAQLPSGRGSAA